MLWKHTTTPSYCGKCPPDGHTEFPFSELPSNLLPLISSSLTVIVPEPFRMLKKQTIPKQNQMESRSGILYSPVTFMELTQQLVGLLVSVCLLETGILQSPPPHPLATVQVRGQTAQQSIKPSGEGNPLGPGPGCRT